MGKNPAITVVAKAEFAQSYIAQPHTAFLSLFMVLPPMASIIRSKVVLLTGIYPANSK
jgi:hypothetical protein